MGVLISYDLVLVCLLFIVFIYMFITSEITSMHKVYFMFHMSMMLWPLCQFAIRMMESPSLQLFFVKAGFANLSLLVVGWLVFTMFLTGRTGYLQYKRSLLLLLPALLAAFTVMENPSGLFVSQVHNSFIQRSYGTLFWFVIVVLLGYLLVSLYLMVRTLVAEDTAPRLKKQVTLLFTGIAILSVFALSDVFFNVVMAGWLPVIPGLTSLGILLSDLCFIMTIYRYNAFNVVQIAHQDIIDTMELGILVLDEDETILEVNQALSPLCKLQVGEHFDMKTYVAQEHIITHCKKFLPIYQEAPERRVEFELTYLEGKLQHFMVHVMPIIVQGIRVGRIITLQDVTEFRRLVDETYLQNMSLHEQNQSLIVVQDELSQVNRKLEQMALTDSLTGCYNRHYLTQYLEQELMKNVKLQMPFAIFLIDIDFFKSVNDQYGHIVGDEVICGTMDAIKSTLRHGDVLARYGGEEFMVYVPNTGRTQAIALAERLKTIVATNQVLTDNNATSISVTISIGLLPIDDFANEYADIPKAYLNELFVSVDEALYQAKKEGRNRINTVVRKSTSPRLS
ncbi:histidine kinase N-terminal 7TM domain-containing diguanylate cyclase [Paenibacillus agricola]|uniref:Diguanylate cyclase n=1 Tax=Paenibacillus agricola TaxID=2716264 RepID=A0ABX0JI78_9BACL|nr:diguanylate cyclase [Paenibacillus agricola]NHN35298.1 diguanylate cyclase [Paenibacillus agricola]